MGIVQWFQNLVTLNGSFTWAYIWKYILSAAIIQGTILTIILAVVAQFLGTLIGFLLYFMRRSRVGILRVFADGYIWILRGTPLLVQVFFFYYLFPYLRLANSLRSIDFFSQIGFTHGTGPIFLDSFLAALLALSLNEGAYMAEIARAGIDSVDTGQLEAAKSLGMTNGLAMRRIVLPQAFRVIVPPLGNEFNNMLKNTSVAAFISLDELYGTARTIGDPIFGNLELLVTAALWYLLLTTIWGFIQGIIERRLNASNIEPGANQGQWWQRAFGLGQRTIGVGSAIPAEH
jgi:polar amino acid transport system permease protein